MFGGLIFVTFRLGPGSVMRAARNHSTSAPQDALCRYERTVLSRRFLRRWLHPKAVVAPSAWENAMPGRELVDGQFPRLQHRITHLELAGALP